MTTGTPNRASNIERENREKHRQRISILVLILLCAATTVLWLLSDGIGGLATVAMFSGGFAAGSIAVYLLAVALQRLAVEWTRSLWLVLALLAFAGLCVIAYSLGMDMMQPPGAFLWGFFLSVLTVSFRRISSGVRGRG